MCKWKESMRWDIDRLRGNRLKDKHFQNCLGCFNIPLWNENHSFKSTKKKKEKKALFISLLNAFCSFFVLFVNSIL